MGAVDTRPYGNGYHSFRDVYPTANSWSTTDLTIPESTEQMFYARLDDEAKNDAVVAEKMVGNAGGNLTSTSTKSILMWIGIIILLITVFHIK